MKTFLVSGYAMVPVLVELTVEAESPNAASTAAAVKWEAMRGTGERQRAIVGNSQDEGAVHDFRPSLATEVKP